MPINFRPDLPPPKFRPDLPQMRHAGSGASGAGFTAAQPPSSAGSPANNAGSRPPAAPTPAPVTMNQRPGGLATGGMLQSLGALGGSEACGGCGKPVRLWQGFASAGDRRFHTWCLKCAGCGQLIQVRATRGKTFSPPRLEMHVCAAQRKCAACLDQHFPATLHD